MIFRAFFIAAVLSATLSACESTSDKNAGSESTSGVGMAAAANANQGRAQAPVAPASILMSDLQASEDFDFATSWAMDINFTLPLTNTYLSICTDYNKPSDGSVDVKFDSCIVRAPVSDGLYHSDDLPMTNAVTSLVAVLIDYANPSLPVYVEFEIQPGKETLIWEDGVNL